MAGAHIAVSLLRLCIVVVCWTCLVVPPGVVSELIDCGINRHDRILSMEFGLDSLGHPEGKPIEEVRGYATELIRWALHAGMDPLCPAADELDVELGGKLCTDPITVTAAIDCDLLRDCGVKNMTVEEFANTSASLILNHSIPVLQAVSKLLEGHIKCFVLDNVDLLHPVPVSPNPTNAPASTKTKDSKDATQSHRSNALPVWVFILMGSVGAVLVIALLGFCVLQVWRRTKEPETCSSFEGGTADEPTRHPHTAVPPAHQVPYVYDVSLPSPPGTLETLAPPDPPHIPPYPAPPTPHPSNPSNPSNEHVLGDGVSTLCASSAWHMITTPAAPEDPYEIVDTSIGRRWQVGLQLLGKGAFGRVYYGVDLELGCPVAIKRLNRDTEEGGVMLPRESVVLRNVCHPNVVTCLGVCDHPFGHHIVMEYLAGGSLASMQKQFGRLKPGLVRQYTTGVLRGLAALHEKGIVHRDVKLENILVSQEGEAKVADFGLAFVTTDSVHTIVLRGTPLYMAPEMLDETVTPACDVWAVGVLVHFLATGVHPLRRFTKTPLLLLAMLANPQSDLTPDTDGAPPRVAEFVRLCMQRDYRKRPTVSQLLLHPFIMEEPGEDSRGKM